jgi:formylglycine-generating enzyme required for sulfatase activity
MAHDIFISHSNKDKPVADAICANLESASLRCWIAPRDVAPGEKWQAATTNAISHSRVMVLVFSAHSNASDDISNEIFLAADAKVVIIPFRIENVRTEPGKQYYLGRTHWLDALNPPTQAQIDQLVERVKLLVPPVEVGSPVQPEAVPAETPPSQENISGTAPAQRAWGMPRGKALLLGSAILLVVIVAGWLISQSGSLQSAGIIISVTNTPTLTTTLEPSLTPPPESSPSSVPNLAEIAREGAKMELIPAGKFAMGSNDGSADERPVHTVSLDAFYMDKYEVTNVTYKLCVDAGGCLAPTDASWNSATQYNNPKYTHHPVIFVTWYQALNYCSWRGVRMPTEAEWEYAARGLNGRTYPWGEVLATSLANYNKSGTTPVGSYENGKSPFGLYDMAGNVWEWVNDWYSETYYQRSPAFNPLGPAVGRQRAMRGGAWQNYEKDVRSADRTGYNPAVGVGTIGFRCARSSP